MSKYNTIKDDDTITTINILHNNYHKKINSENSHFIKNQKLLINNKIEEQEDALDILEKGIDKLKLKSMEISNETKLQKVILDKLDDDINDSNHKIQKTNSILNQIKKNIEKCSFLWIIILIGVLLLFILIFLIIWS